MAPSTSSVIASDIVPKPRGRRPALLGEYPCGAGYGDPHLAPPCAVVELWSPAHLAAVAATALVSALLVAGARRRGDGFAAPAGRLLALVLLAAFAGEQLTYALRGDW